MTRSAKVELRDLFLSANIGTYGPQDVVPDAHIIELTLTIDPDLVQVSADDMSLVFDYDPLIAKISQIAASQKFETQEFLITLIAKVCAGYDEIVGVEICLRKTPVLGTSGTLGVRLTLEHDDMTVLRGLSSNITAEENH